jgi:hypothetical protein
MSMRGWMGFSLCMGLAGCGGGTFDPPDGGVYVFDGAMIGSPDAGPGDGGPRDGGPRDGGPSDGGPRDGGADGGSGEVIPDPVRVVTHIPGLVVTQPLPAAGEEEHGLRVVHVSYVPSTQVFGEYLHEWYFLVHNYGARPACQVLVTFEVRGTSGAVIVSDDLNFVNGDAYRTASGLLVECLSPGEEGMVFSNQRTTTPDPISAVRSISFTVTPGFYEGVTLESEPATIDSAMAYDEFGSGRDRIRGNLRGGARSYRSATANFYLRSASGYFVGWMFDTVSTLPARALVPYETLSEDGRARDWLEHLDFSDPAALRRPADAADLARMAIASQMAASREEDRARWERSITPQPIGR